MYKAKPFVIYTSVKKSAPNAEAHKAQYVSPTSLSFLGRPGGCILFSAASFEPCPLIERRGKADMLKPPLFLRGMPFGAGMALLSISALFSVFLRLGVPKSSSRASSRSMCDTLWEWPWPWEAEKLPPILDRGLRDSAIEDCE